MKSLAYLALALVIALPLVSHAAITAGKVWELAGFEVCTDGRYSRKCPLAIRSVAPAGDGPLVDPWVNEFAGDYLNKPVGFIAVNPPTVDDREIFISSSTGLDTNDCLSAAAPCKTIVQAATLVRDGFSDRVLFKRGDVWIDEKLEPLIKNGRSAEYPLIFAPYGSSGPRPKLQSMLLWNKSANQPKSHLHVTGLHLEADNYDPNSPRFNAGVEGSGGKWGFYGSWVNVTFDDVVFAYIEVVIQGSVGTETGASDNVRFNRTISYEHYAPNTRTTSTTKPSNFFISEVKNLTLNETFSDMGGWSPRVDAQTIQAGSGPVEITGAGPNQFNHNWYVQADNDGFTFNATKNLAMRGSSHGFMFRAGGVQIGNVSAENTVNHGAGGYLTQYLLPPNTPVTVHDNVSIEAVRMHKNRPDWYCGSACSTAIYGIAMDQEIADVGAIVDVRRNIVANRDFSYSATTHDISPIVGDTVTIVSTGVDKNHLYRWHTETQGTDVTYTDPARSVASYAAHIGIGNSLDAFAQINRKRELYQWDDKYTVNGLRDYIRAGFGLGPL